MLSLDSGGLSLLTDFYELTIANAYYADGLKNETAYFDMFFRKVPDNGGFAIMAGLQQLIEYIENLKFSASDLEFLRRIGFHERFLKYLSNFKFECDVWAVPEGTPIFPNEPIITVRGPVLQAQFIETMLLLTVNHQSLIATKANRIVRAAKGRGIVEFGSRRAHGYDASVSGARAAYIGGCTGTTCVLAGKLFGIPTVATMPHSWVQMFDSEYDAFTAYANEHAEDCTLVVDTYNVIQSGIPNAIRVFNEVILPKGYRPKGIRIDSGDITYLSKKSRKMLDTAGFADCEIIASNSIDEYIIRDMLLQGASVDAFSVGERLINASSDPVFGGVYKLAAVEKDGVLQPKIKLSENISKITTPYFKKVWRFFDRETGKAIADLITLHDEVVDENKSYDLFDPEHIWKKKTVSNFVARPLLRQIFRKGKLVYDSPKTEEIRHYCSEQVDMLWEEVKRFENPHKYYVDLSDQLWSCKQRLISEMKDN